MTSESESTDNEQRAEAKAEARRLTQENKRKAAVSRMKASRNSYLAHLGKLQTSVAALDDDVTEEMLRVMSLRLADFSKKIKDLNCDLLLLVEENKLDEEIAMEDTATTRILELEVAISTKLSALAPHVNGPGSSSSSRTTTAAHNTALPKLELPIFSGDFLEWRSFIDQFRAAIADVEMPQVSKLGYLLSCLQGDAKAAVAGLSLTASNYNEAMKILRERFGDPNLLVGLYADRLVNLPAIKENDISAFRALVDQFESSLRELRSLLEEIADTAASTTAAPSSINMHDVLLAPVLSSKLPKNVRVEWARKTEVPTDRFNLTKLLAFAKREVETQEAVRQLDSCSDDRASRDKKFKGQSEDVKKKKNFDSRSRGATSRHATTAVFLTQPAAAEPEKTQKMQDCSVCGTGAHPLRRCSRFLSSAPVERKEIVRKLQFCYNCLHPSHSVGSCTSAMSCYHCNQRHHSLLHLRQMTCSERAAQVTPTPAAHVAPPRNARNLVATSAPLSRPVSKRVLLQSALIKVDGSPHLVRALLDTGAERSYVSQDFVDRVRPAQLSQNVPHRIEAFGGITREQRCSTYRLDLSSRHSPQSVEVQAIAVPTICSPTRGLPSSQLANLQGFELADDLSEEELKVDILLGMDVLPQVMVSAPPLKRGSLLLSPTIFGFVIGGVTGDHGDLNRVFSSKVLKSASPPVSSLWELDAIGVPNPQASSPVVEPIFKGDRYEVNLPWWDERRPSFSLDQAVARARPFHRLTPERQSEYRGVFEQYHELGILETALPHGGNFIPHHGLVQKEKLRVVYDASAKPWNGGPSLNDCLFSGENLLADLTAILLRFRLPSVPLIADVEKAFLMVGVREEDRDYLKIVWFDRNGERKISRFCRVPFGISPGPHLLLRSIQCHLDRFPGSVTIERIRSSLYMDDVVSGGCDDNEALQFKQESVEIFNSAGMNLRGFVSVPRVHQHWSPEPPQPQKVLGIKWDPASDSFIMSMTLVTARTRREILSIIAGLFDPLGLLAPWLIKLKVFMQALWLSSPDWDTPLPSHLIEEWNSLVEETLGAAPLVIPRRLGEGTPTRLLIFADASPRAYAAVVYAEIDGVLSFIIARARVAPLKPLTLTVPRLELMAALLATRLGEFARRELRLDVPRHFFSDSQVALGWIKKAPSDVFVRNRVREILSVCQVSDWSFVPGQENPADLATRGLSPAEFINSPWLQPSCSVEVDSRNLLVTQEPIHTFPFDRFSTYKRMVRVMAWCLRFVENVRGKIRRGPLEPVELESARVKLLLAAQMSTDDYASLSAEVSLPHSSSLWDARPHIEESGLVLCRPRTSLVDSLPWLPIPSAFARLVIQDLHAKLYHQGASATRAEVLRSYWASSSRTFIKQVLKDCVLCRRENARRLTSPEGALPEFRTSPARPFSNVGVDHFGPLFIRDGSKTWVLLFTCAVSRAVHLELVVGLDVRHTVFAIRRFVARRGLPSFWISDNAPTFRFLATALDGIGTWSFIPAAAPWWGGFWERMVGTIKRSLRITLRKSSLSLIELQTVLCEVEDRVNRRPLTALEDDVLTPAHFLLGAAPPALDSPLLAPLPEGADTLFRRALHRQKVAADLWTRWTREYLSTLRAWRTRPRAETSLRQGDIVLVQPPDGIKVSRSRWQMGRVLRLLAGGDTIVRAVELQVGGRITTRPITRLCLLEADPSFLSVALPPRGTGLATRGTGPAIRGTGLATRGTGPAVRGATRGPHLLRGATCGAVHGTVRGAVRGTTRLGRQIKLPARFQ